MLTISSLPLANLWGSPVVRKLMGLGFNDQWNSYDENHDFPIYILTRKKTGYLYGYLYYFKSQFFSIGKENSW